MCLVEVERAPKPVASCAMPIMPGMRILTDSPKVKKAREGVMEFLLINHPLDCPICDQGGECDLQDESMAYGSDSSRHREWKRTVEDKDIGPLVKTVMTRCIQCTRCIRFADEIAGTSVMGATGRGTLMEIGTYIPKVFDSEISGNVIDLCPVGALTNKPYQFNARPWELRSTQTFDVMDAVGSNIRVDARGADILRVLPRLNEEVNEEWIGDKTRFSYDGLKRQRLDMPFMRKGDKFEKVTWKEALEAVAAKLTSAKGSEITALAGGQTDVETMVILKDLLTRFGGSDFRSDSFDTLEGDLRSDYLFNSSLQGVEEADSLLLVGTNPRMEAPVFNARIRKCVLQHGLPVASVGPAFDPAYHEPVQHLGDDLKVLQEIAAGTHPYCKQLAEADKPMLIIGMSVVKTAEAKAVKAVLQQLTARFPKLQSAEAGWNGLNLLHADAARVGQLDAGFVPGPRVDTSRLDQAKFVYLLGADDADSLAKLDEKAFVVYQGHHGDAGAERADVIFPAPAFTEKMGTFVNTEGRVQRTTPVNAPVGEAREDWLIVRALSEVAGATLPYESYEDVLGRAQDVAPHLARSGVLPQTPSWAPQDAIEGAAPLAGPLSPLLDNFFLTNPICRASRIMAQCSKQMPASRNSYAA